MTEAIETSTGSPEREDQSDRDHLADVEVGAGCTEIWEHLSDERAGGD